MHLPLKYVQKFIDQQETWFMRGGFSLVEINLFGILIRKATGTFEQGCQSRALIFLEFGAQDLTLGPSADLSCNKNKLVFFQTSFVSGLSLQKHINKILF